MAAKQPSNETVSKEEQLLEKLGKIRCNFYKNAQQKPNRLKNQKLVWDNIKIVEDLDKILKELSPTNELYPKFAAIQGYYLLKVVEDLQKMDKGNSMCHPPSYVFKCLQLLEPLKLRPEAAWLYTKCSLIHFKLLHSESEMIRCLEKAKVVCEAYFKSTEEEAWDVNNIFEHYESNGKQQKVPSEGNLKELYDIILEQLLHISFLISNHNLLFRYGLDGLKVMMKGTPNPIHFCFKVIPVAAIFLDRHYFKQYLHLTAVAMFKIVEYRQSLPTTLRSTVNCIQSVISLLYAQYGCKILKCSLLNKIERHEEKINENLIKLQDCPGMDLYENQYPVEMVTDIKKMKSILRKSKRWLDRAVELDDSALEAVIHGTFELNVLEQAIQHFHDPEYIKSIFGYSDDRFRQMYENLLDAWASCFK